MDGRSSIRSQDGSNDEEDWLRRHCSSTDEGEVTAPPGGGFDFAHHAATEAAPSSPLPPLPQRVEPTLKERLVERERQARVETERARLKRQFALSSNGGAVEESGVDDLHAAREHGSVIGTVGEESSVGVAAPAIEEEESPGTEAGANEPLGYAMERFLADRTGAETKDAPEEEAKRETGVIMERFLADPVVVDATVPVVEASNDNTGIVSEEESHEVSHEPGDHAVRSSSGSSVSAELADTNNVPDTAPRDEFAEQDVLESTTRDSDINATVGSIRSHSTASDAGALLDVSTALVDSHVTRTNLEIQQTHSRGLVSLQSIESQDGSNMEDDTEMFSVPSHELGSSADETPPRVFRLTEAEIQEMAAIEEASIGNAPPSERGISFSESSLVGDMVAEFGGGLGDVDHHGAMSERTQTTALESESVTDNQSGIDVQETVPSTQDRIDDIAAVLSHHDLSPRASSDGSIASVTAMPPSLRGEPANDDPHQSSNPYVDIGSNTEEDDMILQLERPAGDQHQSDAAIPSRGDILDAVASAAQNAGIVNRTIQPGRVRMNSVGEASLDEASDSGMKRSSSTPMLDGFDFDKYDQPPVSPLQGGLADSFADLPGSEIWSPRGKMCVSPLRLATASSEEQESLQVPSAQLPPIDSTQADEEAPMSRKGTVGQYKDYGSAPLGLAQPTLINRRQPAQTHLSIDRLTEESEHRPLLQSRESEAFSSKESSDHTLVDSIFSSVRSDSTATIEEEVNESDAYLASSMWSRAFPERFFALVVTLIVEIPTVLMISGGSDRLCTLIGRSRYQLMMAFLPLSSAISGNVGLQASTLTTRAISHRHVTKEDFSKWFLREVGAAAYLGFGMGVVIGSVAYIASDYDFGFGVTIFVAQQVSILTAGLTGTFAPLLFSFIFHRDSGKWGGPLETAVQDIVGSFAMVVLSYRILVFLGPGEVDPSDTCGGGQF